MCVRVCVCVCVCVCGGGGGVTRQIHSDYRFVALSARCLSTRAWVPSPPSWGLARRPYCDQTLGGGDYEERGAAMTLRRDRPSGSPDGHMGAVGDVEG